MNRPNELIGTTLRSAAGHEEARRVHLSGLATRVRGGAVGPLNGWADHLVALRLRPTGVMAVCLWPGLPSRSGRRGER